MSHRTPAQTFPTSALLLGRVEYGDADLIVTLFTEERGRLSALARGARRSQKRFQGSLEPFHTLRVELGAHPRGELFKLHSSSIECSRDALVSNLDALTQGGRALKWLRLCAPAGAHEPALWQATCSLLDRLADKGLLEQTDGLLGGYGIRLLELLGWGLNFQNCVRCGKQCPQERSSWVSPEHGGLMCGGCGGGPFKLSAVERAHLLAAARSDEFVLDASAALTAFRIVNGALRSHLGIEEAARLRS